jgi:hypothetical protein
LEPFRLNLALKLSKSANMHKKISPKFDLGIIKCKFNAEFEHKKSPKKGKGRILLHTVKKVKISIFLPFFATF